MRIHYAAGVNAQQNLSGSSITLCILIARFPRVLCDWSSCMRFSSRRSDLPEAKTRAFSFWTECQNNHPDKKFSSLIPIADTSYAIYDGYQVFGSRARLRRALRVRPSLRLRAPPLRHLGPALNLGTTSATIYAKQSGVGISVDPIYHHARQKSDSYCPSRARRH